MKTDFELVPWHWSSLYQVSLEPTQPNGLGGCKMQTDHVQTSVKAPMHMGYQNIYYTKSSLKIDKIYPLYWWFATVPASGNKMHLRSFP